MKKTMLCALALSTLALSSAQAGLPKLVSDAASNQISGCVVKLLVDGSPYNQLYVLGAFSGNYTAAQSSTLESLILTNMENGNCSYFHNQQPVIDNTPREILDAQSGLIPYITVTQTNSVFKQLAINGTVIDRYTTDQNAQLAALIQANDIRYFPQAIQDCAAGLINNCSLTYFDLGTMNELYIRGSYQGFFKISDLGVLNDRIEACITQKTCSYKTPVIQVNPPVYQPVNPSGNSSGQDGRNGQGNQNNNSDRGNNRQGGRRHR